jgi:hypothetical protein
VIRLAAIGIGAAVFAFGLLSHNHFPNDHFVHLSSAAQILAGEWPTRDFVDPGMPLMYLASAAAQWIGGRTLLAEALLVYGAIGVAACLLVLAVARLTGSTLLGCWAGVCLLLMAPRTYSYPKVLLYATAVYLLSRNAGDRTSRTPIALGALTAVAFLFRHDHGAYIGAASIAWILFAKHDAMRLRLRHLASYATAAAVVVLPYLVFVQLNGGLHAYVASAVEFSQHEARRTRLESWTPSLLAKEPRTAATAALFYAFWTLPVVAALIGRGPSETALAVLAVAANAGFLRDRLEDRMADAIVPAATLMAIVAASLFRRGQSLLGVAVLVCFAAGAAIVGGFPQRIASARWTQVTSELRAPRAAPQMPSAVALALMPFFEYVEACTRENAAIFVPGFAPEVPYFSRRRFAGGHVTLVSDYYSSEREENRTLQILNTQSVPLVVLPPGAHDEIEQHHPRVSRWLQRYVPVATYVDHQGRTTEIRVRMGLPALRPHELSGLPCFR